MILDNDPTCLKNTPRQIILYICFSSVSQARSSMARNRPSRSLFLYNSGLQKGGVEFVRS